MIGHIHLGYLFFAGISGGYLMIFVGYWMEGFLGLPRFDSSKAGLVYLGGEKPERWTVGILFHLFDSVLIALIYAGWFIDVTTGPLWFRGLLFGVLLGIMMYIVFFIGSWAGSVHFKRIPKTRQAIFVEIFLSAIYGLILGILYVPGH